MKLRGKLAYIVLICVLLSSGILLLVSVWAQAPGQEQIAFASFRDGNIEIYVMDADGKNPRRLTNHPAWDEYPAWSVPSGARSVLPASKIKATWGWIKQDGE